MLKMKKNVRRNEGTTNFKDATCMAFGSDVPVAGERYNCTKVEVVSGQPKLTRMRTSTVQEVSVLGKNIFKIATCNSVYIIQVG